MGKIIEAGDLPEGERVYLKKDIFGWRVVEPWKDPQTEKINWFNFITGGKKNIVMLIILMIILGIGYIGLKENISNYKIIADNPCDFCTDCRSGNINITKLNATYLNPIIIPQNSGGEINEN